MTSAKHQFDGCNLRALGSTEIVLLSGCWKLERVQMIHREDGRVDLDLTCDQQICLCAQALNRSRACNPSSPRAPGVPPLDDRR